MQKKKKKERKDYLTFIFSLSKQAYILGFMARPSVICTDRVSAGGKSVTKVRIPEAPEELSLPQKLSGDSLFKSSREKKKSAESERLHMELLKTHNL